MAETLPCMTVDPEMFFIDGSSPDPDGTLAEAQRLCGGCSVRGSCYTNGVQTKSSGVWGGILLERGEVKTLRSPPRRGRTAQGKAEDRCRPNVRTPQCSWPGS